MQMKEKKTSVFEIESIPKAVAVLAIPSVLSMLVTVLYNMVDTVFVGQTHDPYQMNAVSMATPVFMILMAFGNLFGIFLICYFIMWFAVPAARSARQKLEMNGEKITAQAIGETTAAAANNDPDAKAKPIVAEAVSVFGKVVLILLKLFAGLIVFCLIMVACALIIGLFAILIGGAETLNLDWDLSLWVPILGIFIALIPTILLIYVLMCLIASRKPGGKTVLVIFLCWIASIIACSTIAIREKVGERFRDKREAIRDALNSTIEVDGEMTTLKELLEEYDGESIIEEGRKTLHISVPSKELDITVDKKQGGLQINAGERTTNEEGDSITSHSVEISVKQQ